MRNPSSADLIVELIRTLDEARTDQHPSGDGGGVIQMPVLYTHGSYAELERRLAEMRDSEFRQQWWHLSMRYRWGCVRRLHVRSRKTRKGRVPEIPARTELRIIEGMSIDGLVWVHCYLWSDRVEPRFVNAGVRRLLATMYDGDTSKLTLPREFLERLLSTERSRYEDDELRARDDQHAALTATQSSSRARAID